MLAALSPTAGASMQLTPCKVSTLKPGGTTAFWWPINRRHCMHLTGTVVMHTRAFLLIIEVFVADTSR